MMDFAIPTNTQAERPIQVLFKLRLSLLGQVSDVGFQIPDLRVGDSATDSRVSVAESLVTEEVEALDEIGAPKTLKHHLLQGFLNLIIVLTSVVIFSWFGPSLAYDLVQGWQRVTTVAGTQVASQPTKLISTETNLPTYFQRFNQWANGLSVTPIAGQSATEPKVVEPSPTPTPVKYLPVYDETLPEGNWLVIPRIGVRSELQKNPDFEKSLERGLWQVPDFGDPGSTDLPMIVAGHRYGWDWWWKSDYWKYNSFYLLPSLQVGDRVEVISDHRKWLYEVYASEEGEQISDYSGDLILYTCKYLNSPARFFRYARLVDPTVGSQP